MDPLDIMTIYAIFQTDSLEGNVIMRRRVLNYLVLLVLALGIAGVRAILQIRKAITSQSQAEDAVTELSMMSHGKRPCASEYPHFDRYHPHHFEWTPDGASTHIRLRRYDLCGWTRKVPSWRALVDAHPADMSFTMVFYADLSPQGTQVVYSYLSASHPISRDEIAVRNRRHRVSTATQRTRVPVIPRHGRPMAAECCISSEHVFVGAQFIRC